MTETVTDGVQVVEVGYAQPAGISPAYVASAVAGEAARAMAAETALGAAAAAAVASEGARAQGAETANAAAVTQETSRARAAEAANALAVSLYTGVNAPLTDSAGGIWLPAVTTSGVLSGLPVLQDQVLGEILDESGTILI